MQQKAKYHLSDGACDELDKLDEIEDALKVLTRTYNELHEATWQRMRKAYFLVEGKEYKYDPKNCLIREV